jgi:hypothetical protein
MNLEEIETLPVDDFSRRFAQWVGSRRPDVLERLELDPSPEGPFNTLLATFDSPVPGLPPIQITTWREEITLLFDRWHTHFAFFSEIPDEEGFEQAMEWLDLLQTEQVGVAISMVGEAWKGSQSWHPGESLPEPQPGGYVYVRSWRGTYNQG